MTKADADLDRLLVAVEEQREAAERLDRTLDEALFTAQSRVRSVSDFIDTRRGSIGPEARTRLAEAVRHIGAAEAKRATDPSEAVAHANGAAMLAAQAQARPSADVEHAQRSYTGRCGGGGGGNMGAVIGGIIIGNILGGAMRGGFGGGGCRSAGDPSAGRAVGGRRHVRRRRPLLAILARACVSEGDTPTIRASSRTLTPRIDRCKLAPRCGATCPTFCASRRRATIDNNDQSISCKAARFWRSRRKRSGSLCQSKPSYSTATFRSGQAKSTRHSPPVTVDDLVLQCWGGNPPSMHHQPRLALHRRFGFRCGTRDEFAHVHDSSPTGLLGCRGSQLATVAGLASQCSVEGGQGAWPTKAACDLDGCPCRRGRRTTVDLGQRRAVTAVHDQTVIVAQLVPIGIEDVKVDDIFGVESVGGRGGCRGRSRLGSPARRSSPRSRTCVSGSSAAIYAGPHLHQFAPANPSIELAPTEHGQQLSRCGHTALTHRRFHRASSTIVGCSSDHLDGRKPMVTLRLWMDGRLGTSPHPAGVRELAQIVGVSARRHARSRKKREEVSSP